MPTYESDYIGNNDINESKVSIIEMFCVILLAMCPILQHYRGLFVNAGVTALLIVFPFAVFKLCNKRLLNVDRLKFVAPLVIFFLFKVVDHSTDVQEFGQAVVFSVVVIAIACECFDTKYFIRVVLTISKIASILIILQYFCYYILHFHVRMVPTNLLLERASQWILGAKTGRAGITGRVSRFYRPSAFFLEPSHMFIYMFMPLIYTMFSPNFGRKERRDSILLTVGMILTTSGMGIITAVGMWIIFLGKQGENNKFSLVRFFNPKIMLLIIIGVVTAFVLYSKVPFVHNSVVRIFSSGTDYTNAISGRVASGNKLVRGLSGMQRIIGVKDDLSGIDFNMSGFNSTMYQYGIIGTVISYVFYLSGVFKLKSSFVWISIVTIVLSFFSAHTHTMFFMIYCTFVLVEGYNEKIENEISA